MTELVIFLAVTILLAGAGIRLGMLVGHRLSAALDRDEEDASDAPS